MSSFESQKRSGAHLPVVESMWQERRAVVPDADSRSALIQQTLSLLQADAPWLRERVAAVVDGLPHIFHYTTEERPRMVRFHLLHMLGMPDDAM